VKSIRLALVLFSCFPAICTGDAAKTEPLYLVNTRIYECLMYEEMYGDEASESFAEATRKKDVVGHSFALASMYYGVRSNGGSLHALGCFEDELPDLINCLRRIGATKIVTTLLWGQKHFAELDNADSKNPAGLALIKKYEAFEEESDEELDVLLFEYWKKHAVQ
jgi:hypothetical protein